MKKSLIVAMDQHGLIGRDNQLPWRLSADLQHFRRLTLGKPIIMGRKTYESIGRALPERSNIVVTRQTDWSAEDALVAHSLAEAFALAATATEAFVIGGAEVYAQALQLVDTFYLTRVQAALEGDTYFPPVDWSVWQLQYRTTHERDARNEYDYAFEHYQRLTGALENGDGRI